MPTTIWIKEAAEDRFWEAAPPVPKSPSYPCPYCEAAFGLLDLLEEHVRGNHFLDLPVLMIRGQHIATEGVIRAEVRRTDIRLINSTKVLIRQDGGGPREFTPGQFCSRFCRERHAHWLVTLINSRNQGGPQSEREYRLEFRIPASAELDEIDRRFIQYLAVDHPTHADIRLFVETCNPSPTAREYLGALTDYTLGVMIKDQVKELVAALGFDEYRAKYVGSRTVLREFARPVANAITSCVDFNLNGFTGPEAPSRLYVLTAAHKLFRALACAAQLIRQPAVGTEGLAAAICPTDTVTDALLSESVRYMRGARLGADTAERLLRLVSTKAISEFDKPKVHVLSALCYLEAGEPANAADHLRQVQFNSLFGEWARRRLEEQQ
ncbi:MAG: hypothetical protein WC713_04730 [Candidatus Methylomirabilota bacterium]